MSINFISIETATNICSVSVFKNNELLALKESEIMNSHSSNITLFIKDALKTSGLQFVDLSAIAVSAGPGSYTGLRIGTSAAKAIAFSLNIPLIAYNTLKSLVCGLLATNKSDCFYGAAIDARRDEVYIAIYDNNLNNILAPQNMILKKGALKHILADKTLIISGNGGEKVRKITKNPSIIYDHFVKCSSKHPIKIIIKKYQSKQFEETAYFEPIYIKPFFTLQKSKI